MILKGAPERVLDKCILTQEERNQIDSRLQDLMSKGLRVLCFASRSLTELPKSGTTADPGGTGSSTD